MAKLTVKKDDTSRREYVFVLDSASTTGAGKTGIAYNAGGIKAYYVRPGGSATAISLKTQTVTGAYDSGGWVEVDSTNMPGLYRFDIPNAVFATGVDKAIVMVSGASGMAPVVLEYDLVGYDPGDAVRLGLSALPNAAAEAAGGLITRGTGTGQLSVTSGAVTVGTNNDKTGYSLTQSFPTNFSSLAITATGIVTANTTQLDGQNVTASTGVTFPASVGTSTLTSSQAADAVWGANITNNSVPAAWGNDTMGRRILRSDSNTRADVLITGTSPDPGKLAADVYNIQDAKITAASIADSGANDIADATLKRSIRDADGGVEKSAADYSLATTILGMLENSISGTTLTIYESDGTTTHLTRALGVADASTADVITSVS